MFKRGTVITFYAETPIRMGSGQSVSYVDLPVQREKHTSFPILWASGIKGVIRDLALRVWNDREKVEIIFGPEDGSDFASCLSITDAKILLYPVRSVRGVFAWITCPFVLRRFFEDLNSIGLKDNKNQDIINVSDEKILISPKDSSLKINESKVALEEFVFEIEDTNSNEIDELAEELKKFLPDNPFTRSLDSRLAIVSDDIFRDFVNYAVEIRTRIRIDQLTGTVKEQALFSEELIPSESIFYSLLFVSDPFLGINSDLYNEIRELKRNQQEVNWEEIKKKIQGSEEKKEKVLEKLKKAFNGKYFISEEIYCLLEEFLDGNLLQLGSDETVGKGYCRVKFVKNESLSGGRK